MTIRMTSHVAFCATMVALVVLFPSSADAQFFPTQHDRASLNLHGPVKKVVESTRQYESQTGQWKPLTISEVREFSRNGHLMRDATYIWRDTTTPDRILLTYDAEDTTLHPIMESGIGAGAAPGSTQLLLERLFAYREDGAVDSVIVRNHQTGQTTFIRHNYESYGLQSLVTVDSASKSIVRIEAVSWANGTRPMGSTILKIPREAGLRTVADTGSLNHPGIRHAYSSYSYGDPETPIIYWQWNYGVDTAVDRQIIKRYRDDTTLYSSVVSDFVDGKVAHTRSQIFDPYGEPVSSSMTQPDGTTREQAFVYKYFGSDDDPFGNWRKRSAFAASNPADPEADPVPTGRTDRDISYYDSR